MTLTTVAREIVASIFEGEGTDLSRACAKSVLSGAYDNDPEMKIAKAALVRGLSEGLGAEQFKAKQEAA
jgi:hypothetical protein